MDADDGVNLTNTNWTNWTNWTNFLLICGWAALAWWCFTASQHYVALDAVGRLVLSRFLDDVSLALGQRFTTAS